MPLLVVSKDRTETPPWLLPAPITIWACPGAADINSKVSAAANLLVCMGSPLLIVDHGGGLQDLPSCALEQWETAHGAHNDSNFFAIDGPFNV